MSEAKAPKKGDAGSKKSEAKTEAKKPEGEPSAVKADAPPKLSASQSSISHFSSVSTPAYRAGWDAIFGGAKADKKPNARTRDRDDVPDQLAISDEDIDAELRNILYKRFQRQARKQGFSLAKTKKLADIGYRLECNIKLR